MDAGMALRALSANNFLSRFLFLAVVGVGGGGGDFFVEDERGGVLDGDLLAVDCFELLEDLLVLDLGLDLDLLTRLSSLIIAPVIFCDSLCLDLLRDRPTDVDPDDSIRRTLLLVVVLRFDCLLDIIS